MQRDGIGLGQLDAVGRKRGDRKGREEKGGGGGEGRRIWRDGERVEGDEKKEKKNKDTKRTMLAYPPPPPPRVRRN